MSDAIAPISDALDSPQLILADQEQRREMLARLAAADRVERVHVDETALAARLAQLRGQDQALSNIKDTLNITAATQVAVGHSTEILARLKELALQSTSETLGTAQREVLQIEFDALKLQLDQLATATAARTNASTAATTTGSLDAENNGVPTEAATELSTASHDLIVEHTDASVLAQANQVPGVALKLLEET
jgi:flagellin